MNRKTILLALLLIAAVFTLASCATKGTVTILEQSAGADFVITFRSWSDSDTVTLPLTAGDEVRINVASTEGSLAMTLSSLNGAEPYTGKGLTNMAFTVAVPETDTYTMQFTGDHITGTLTVTK